MIFEVEIEVWDNNVVLQFPGGDKHLSTFRNEIKIWFLIY